MASNPKYAELPGFAHNQPDVYETDDLPESEQQQTEDIETESDSVEVLHISTKDAYNKFKHCRVDASKTDFTESIISKKKTGFDVIYGEWEINDDKEQETLEQRYHRLKAEVKGFIDDMSQMKEDAKKVENHEVFLADMQIMEKLLVDVNLDSVLGDGVASCGDPHMDTQKRLMTQLAALKSKEAAPDDKKPKAGGDGSSITYELFYKPEYSKLQQATQVAQLEERLRQIEHTIGSDKQKISVLTSIGGGGMQRSLQDICELLVSKLTLLEPQNLEQVEAHLAGLQQRLLAISQQKQALDEAQKAQQISQMYDVIKRCDHLHPSLTTVIATLASLRELHEHALQFTKCLASLESQQQLIDNQLKSDEVLLNTIQERLQKDMANIAANIGKLEVRMEAFKK